MPIWSWWEGDFFKEEHMTRRGSYSVIMIPHPQSNGEETRIAIFYEYQTGELCIPFARRQTCESWGLRNNIHSVARSVPLHHDEVH
jgi:hypothetical protein